MRLLFAPYNGTLPASVVINGHKLIILSQDKQELEDNLGLVGGEHIEPIPSSASVEEQDKILYHLAEAIQGGIVIAPAEEKIEEVIRNLETQLPWVQ